MHDPNYVKMPNATHAIMQLNRLGYLGWHMNVTIDIRIQRSIEIRCSLNDAPSPVHARQMNDANMQSIRYANQNHRKRLSEREKDVGFEDMHTHAHLLQYCALAKEGPNK